MKLSEICDCLEAFAPLQIQEAYDNSGLILGNKSLEIKGILICLDVTEGIVNEAIEKKCNLIVSHHPFIFSGLKKINGQNTIERILEKCIRKEIAVYAAHTNLDNASEGVNKILCEKLGLRNTRILSPKKDLLRKLVTFCPTENAGQVRKALFDAGGGFIGNYDNCSFNTSGTGTFRALENANPYVGEIGELHQEAEMRIETIYPMYIERNILEALIQSHPYEEVAYDIYPLGNEYKNIGSGMVGDLNIPCSETDFLNFVKKTIKTGCIKHSSLLNAKIKKVAVCGGSGIFLLKEAIASGADVFITADVKYHDFFAAEGKIIIADVGHYESEQFTKELLYTILLKKFPKFALFISEENTNSVNYL